MTDIQVVPESSPREAPSLRYYDYHPMRAGRMVASFGPRSLRTEEWTSTPAWDETSFALVPRTTGSISAPIATRAFERFYEWLLNVIIADRSWPQATASRAVAQDVEPELRHLVDLILDDWASASRHQASMRRAAKHRDFQLLRRLGPLAVDAIAERNKSDASPLWVWALGELTGEDPAEGATTVPEAAQAWARWADTRSFA